MTVIQKDEPLSWEALRKYTPARVALGHTGGSMLTQQLLKFKLDHAKARDAVEYETDWTRLAENLRPLFPVVLQFSSRAYNRTMYLQRPDLGKMLDEHSVDLLNETASKRTDVCVVAADGLSAYALERNLGPLLFAFIPKLHEHNLSASPLCLVKGGRVAVGDEIGQRLTSNVAVVCIGERPGLSSTDSLGVYMTFDPKIGRTDESRNCISNIRSEGLKPHFAAEKLLYLIKKSLQMQCSGVQLKDESDPRLGNAQVW